MSKYDSSGWPAVDDDVIVDALKEAIEDGRRDQLGGGVHYSVLIDYVDDITDAEHLMDRLNDLADEGRLKRVRGVGRGDSRPRTSFLPRGFEGGDDHA